MPTKKCSAVTTQKCRAPNRPPATFRVVRKGTELARTGGSGKEKNPARTKTSTRRAVLLYHGRCITERGPSHAKARSSHLRKGSVSPSRTSEPSRERTGDREHRKRHPGLRGGASRH